MMTRVIFICFFCMLCVQFSDQKPERCFQAQETGPCRARIPRLFYDSATNSCREFIYGGCDGNDNNFETIEDCDNVCVSEKTTEVSGDRCNFRPDAGNCKAMFQRHYYDSETNICKMFTYGGCGGNDNNFESIELCQNACVKDMSMDGTRCFLKHETGMCRARIPRLYYDSDTNKCKEFIYGGCGGNDNNFETLEECDRTCVSMKKSGNVCHLPKTEGPCKSKIPRLYYDASDNSCKEFSYGGCAGNENNFETFGECEDTCIKSSASDQDNICLLRADRGPCKGMMFRHYYNSTQKTCGEFVYGGCAGNANNFETKDQCEKQCGNHAAMSSLTNLFILIICLPLIMTRKW